MSRTTELTRCRYRCETDTPNGRRVPIGGRERRSKRKGENEGSRAQRATTEKYGRRATAISQPLSDFNCAHRSGSTFHPSDDDLTRTKEEGSFPFAFPTHGVAVSHVRVGWGRSRGGRRRKSNAVPPSIILSVPPFTSEGPQQPDRPTDARATYIKIKSARWIMHNLERLLPQLDRQ